MNFKSINKKLINWFCKVQVVKKKSNYNENADFNITEAEKLSEI